MKNYLSGRVIVKTGDITLENVDIIVNAANSSLLGGGGVDGAIHRAGGSAILAECKQIRAAHYPNGLPTGEAVMTTAGKLKAQAVIHTAGPIYHSTEHPDILLRNCYLNSLTLAKKSGFHSIAFPAISTGVYGYPKNEAAAISSKAVKDFLETDNTLETVIFIFYSEPDMQIFCSHQKFC